MLFAISIAGPLFFVLLRLASTLEVALNSRCAPLCLDDPSASASDPIASSTQPQDVVCEDWELDGYNSTGRGRKWNQCLTCESTSNAHNGRKRDETDTYWFLYNMKVTVILCVWQYPTTDRNDSAAATSCADVCADSDNHMKMAMMDQTTTIDNDLQYQYCSSNYSAFTKNYQACSNCLETVPQAQTMINYLRILNDACAQQPAAGTGKQISLDFPLFPNGTSAAPSSAVASATGDASTKTSVGATSTSGATPSDQSSAVARSSNSLAAKVGVGVGIGLGLPLLAALAGLLFLLGRRRADRRKEQEESMRRLAWEEGYKAKVMAEAEELHGGTKILPEMMTTALVEADAGPPAVPEKDSYLVTSPNISSPTRSSGSPYGHDNVEVDRDPPIQEQSDDILRSNTPRSVHNR